MLFSRSEVGNFFFPQNLILSICIGCPTKYELRGVSKTIFPTAGSPKLNFTISDGYKLFFPSHCAGKNNLYPSEIKKLDFGLQAVGKIVLGTPRSSYLVGHPIHILSIEFLGGNFFPTSDLENSMGYPPESKVENLRKNHVFYLWMYKRPSRRDPMVLKPR